MVDGTVIDCGYSDTYGNFVHIKINKNTYISYNHLNKVLVKKGEFVTSGDIIALSGNTGASTGPHLHLSLFTKDNPKDILPMVKYDYTEGFLKEFEDRGEPFIYEN